MPGVTDPEITFVRLTEVDLDTVTALLNEPRNARHLPLSRGDTFTAETAAAWVASKDGQWDEHGYGPWAVLIDGDFALVLRPSFWGHGETVVRQALARGFGELGLEQVLIALPYSRRPDRVVARYGFLPDGDVEYAGTCFRQYRLTRAAWSARPSS